MANVAHLKAPDISCGHCVQTVQNAVRKLDGVEDVHASAETKIVDVTFDTNALNLEQIQAALANAGYPAKQI